MERSNVFAASSRRSPWLALVVSIAALYFAKQVLVPLALAVLFAFLLTPAVTRLERLRLGRVPSVLLVLIVSFSVAGGIGWIVANQLIEIVDELPNYTSNIREKMEVERRYRDLFDSIQEGAFFVTRMGGWWIQITLWCKSVSA